MAKPRLMKVRALFYIHRTCPGASPSSVVDWNGDYKAMRPYVDVAGSV